MVDMKQLLDKKVCCIMPQRCVQSNPARSPKLLN